MYHLSHFKPSNPQDIDQFIAQYPLALVTTHGAQELPVASHLPLLTVRKKNELYLCGHFMTQTDHGAMFTHGKPVLAVFSGPNAYVSATWYTGAIGGSTYNYMAVHAAGTLEIMSSLQLAKFMQSLSLHFEQGNQQSATVFENLPPDYRDKMMPHITGFSIKVNALDAVFKLSQNMDAQTRANIISKLRQQGGMAALLAQEMQNYQ